MPLLPGKCWMWYDCLMRSYVHEIYWRKIGRLTAVGLLVSSVFLGAFRAAAAEIVAEQARTAAEAWCRRNPGFSSASAPAGVRTVSDLNGTAIGHLVDLEDGTTLLLSADDGVTPVLAFSAEGLPPEPESGAPGPFWALARSDLLDRTALARGGSSVGAASRPSGFRTLDDSVGAEVGDAATRARAEWAELLAEGSGMRVAGVASVSDIRVAPLVQTKWGQSKVGSKKVFNYKTPVGCVCGCVATAGAQIMRYHRHPTASVSRFTRTCTVNGVSTNCTSIGGVYDWANMPVGTLYAADITTAHQTAIGTLCYDVGVAVRMDWTTSSSGAYSTDLATAFKNYFGYSGAVSYSVNSGISAANLSKALLPCFDAGYPAALGILGTYNGETVGHAIVADGYGYSGTDLYVHLNMGWNGSQNLWYNLPAVGTEYQFSAVQDIVYNIYPTGTGSILSGRVVSSVTGEPVVGASVTAVYKPRTGSSTTVTATTGANGIYAVRVADPTSFLGGGTRSWTVTVEKNGTSASKSVTMSSASSRSVGNSPNNDFVLAVDTRVWNPEECLPEISGAALSADGASMSLSFDALGGLPYEVQRAPALGGPWTPLSTNTPVADGVLRLSAPVDTSAPAGFFRVRALVP